MTNAQYLGGALVTFTGANSHAHTTPMSKRRNALAGAARLAVEIERIGLALEPDGTTMCSNPNCPYKNQGGSDSEGDRGADGDRDG